MVRPTVEVAAARERVGAVGAGPDFVLAVVVEDVAQRVVDLAEARQDSFVEAAREDAARSLPEFVQPVAQATASARSAVAIGGENNEPWAALTTFGFSRSVLSDDPMNPAPNESQVRTIAPMLPGFSMASPTRTNAGSGGEND